MRDLIEIVSSPDTKQFWHGGRWDGSPEVQSPKKGRYEAGPGIYLTTRYSTARKYAKGGGSTILVDVDANLNFADKTDMPVEKAVAFVQNLPRMKAKKAIIDDLHYSLNRKGSITAQVLVNLVVNHEAGSGEVGLEVAAFIRSLGVDASLEHKSGQEQWLVIYNPKVIRSYRKVASADVTDAMFDLPGF
jgi:hypothetical protein